MAHRDKQELLELYRKMLKLRMAEESLVEHIASGEIKCPVHLYTGQEAVAVGVCSALRTEDSVFGTHRSHGHYLAKGGDLNAMFAEIFCKAAGCSGGRGGSMHLYDLSAGFMGAAPIVAGTISLALGSALAKSIRGDGTISVSFFGDGATGEGVLYESMNFASLRCLPVVFVCENNLYSTHMPISECRQSNSIYEIAPPLGVASWSVDGNDVLAIQEVAEAAVSRARKGDGPGFIECRTYRMRGHVGPDDNVQGTHTDIRPAEEVEEWKRRDPIQQLERVLTDESGVGDAELSEIRAEIRRAIDQAIAYAQGCKFPEAQELANNVFA